MQKVQAVPTRFASNKKTLFYLEFHHSLQIERWVKSSDENRNWTQSLKNLSRHLP